MSDSPPVRSGMPRANEESHGYLSPACLSAICDKSYLPLIPSEERQR